MQAIKVKTPQIFCPIFSFLSILTRRRFVMSHVTSPALQTVHADHSRIGLIALWAVQLALAGMFLLAGGSKLAGAPAMIALFDGIGIGQWFRYVTGLIEVGSA